MRITPLRESSVEAKAVRLAGDAGWRTVKAGMKQKDIAAVFGIKPNNISHHLAREKRQ